MNINPNLAEIGNIVKNMTSDFKSSPNYNASAAEIVKQGTEDKLRAKYAYSPSPASKPSEKKRL